MGLRPATSDAIYPFTPRAESVRGLVAGISDALLVVISANNTAPVAPPEWAAGYSAYLDTIEPIGDALIYTFKISADGLWSEMVFKVPTSGGILTIRQSGGGSSVLLVNTLNLPKLTHITDVRAEVEPSRLIFQLSRISRIRLFNEWREADPGKRDEEIASHPDSLVVEIEDGGTLSLASGWNCSVGMADSTLWVDGGPGRGKGKPSEFPWDGPYPDIFTGIYSVNGLNVDGDVPMELGESLLPLDLPGGIGIRIK